MEVYHGLNEFKKITYPVVTSGTFDGVHIGHQIILKRLNEIAQKSNGESVVLTFWPHPRFVLQPDNNDLQLLSTLEERIALLKNAGVDHLIIIEFTKAFSELSSADFIQKILVDAIGTKKLVIGYDHRFGKKREGSFEYLKENAHLYGFEIEEIPPQDVDNVTVSSSKVRKALISGDITTANQCLNHPYRITGKVAHGNKIGKTIGYPTANITIPESFKLIPGNGIYAVKVVHKESTYKGMLSIGVRPTLDASISQNKRTIEVNIFDFNQSIYGETLSIDFIKYIRAEEKFDDLAALKDKIAEDERIAKDILQTS